MSNARQDLIRHLEGWFEGLRKERGSNLPARGKTAAALVVLERLKTDFELPIEAHRTKGGGQIRGVAGRAVTKILAAHGEVRPFLSEGGRTNRGSLDAIESLLFALRDSGIGSLSETERTGLLNEAQRFLVDRGVRGYLNSQRLKVVFEPGKTTEEFFSEIIRQAAESGKAGPVAQYMIGAKLQLRFPELHVDNNSFTTADIQLGRAGDFLVGDTAFHVTIAPMPSVYQKCKDNLSNGLKCYLLVPLERLNAARENAEMTAGGRIAVQALESFLAQNLDELTVFDSERTAQKLKQLLDTYNARVNEVENDKSMLIELPRNLS